MHPQFQQAYHFLATSDGVNREVEGLLMQEARLDESSLRAVGWGPSHADELTQEIKTSIRTAAAAAFADAKRKTTGAIQTRDFVALRGAE